MASSFPVTPQPARSLRPLRLLLLCLLPAWVAALLWTLSGVSRLPAAEGHYAAAVLLFNGWEGEGDELNGESVRRVAHGVALWRAGRVGALICAGGLRAGRAQRGALQMCALARAMGVPAAALQADAGSYDTWSNLDEAARIARERGWGRLLLVSSPVHLARIHDQGLYAGRGIEFGFAPHDGHGESAWSWLLALHYDAATRVATALLGRGGMDWLARLLRPQASAPA